MTAPETTPDIPGFITLTADLETLREAMRNPARPMNREFLFRFAEELELIFKKVKFDPEFRTPDDRIWNALSFLYTSDNRFKFIFSQEGDQVHLYCQCEEVPTPKEVSNVVRATTHLLLNDLRDFYWNR